MSKTCFQKDLRMFPQCLLVLPYGNQAHFNENASMQAIAKILQAQVIWTKAKFCENF